MPLPATPAVRLRAPPAAAVEFQRDIIAGLSAKPKRLPSKYFYDARGSALFERICEQPEYYLTRVELALMHDQVVHMAQALGPQVRLVEFGSGAGTKTRLLLAALPRPVAYVPVEISEAALEASLLTLSREFPRIDLQALCADFTEPFELPQQRQSSARTVVYFPGSTLGNFDANESVRLLRQMRRLAGANGAVLIGLDLKKSAIELEAAYNDVAGVTAEFTLNLLTRINRELGADFDLARFRHRAVYNPLASRIETCIVSRVDQQVTLAGRRFEFAALEAMQVEVSCKYSNDDVQRLARKADLQVTRLWSDSEDRFGVFLLEATR